MRFRAIFGGGVAAMFAGAYALPVALTKGKTESKPVAPHHHKIVIVGGGTGGLTVANQLLKHASWEKIMSFGSNAGDVHITIVEPSSMHYYQPLWTMAGAGLKNMQRSEREMRSVIPDKSKWIQDSVHEIKPKDNLLTLSSGEKLTYDYLILAPGHQRNWSKIPGLKEAIDDPTCPVGSVYSQQYVEKTTKLLKDFKGGDALFVNLDWSAPMWLWEAEFRSRNMREDVNMIITTPETSLFPVRKYAQSLQQLAMQRGIITLLETELVRVNPKERTVELRDTASKRTLTKTFDVLHVKPLLSSPDFIANSPLADATGYVAVDTATLRHKTFENVYAIGDCASLPIAKTAAGIASQAPVLVHNLITAVQAKQGGQTSKSPPSLAKYDGYTGCPILLGNRKLMLPEYTYSLEPKETFPWDQSKPSWILYYVKKDFFPWIYWYGFIRGSWYGRNHFIKPPFPEDLLFRD